MSCPTPSEPIRWRFVTEGFLEVLSVRNGKAQGFKDIRCKKKEIEFGLDFFFGGGGGGDYSLKVRGTWW